MSCHRIARSMSCSNFAKLLLYALTCLNLSSSALCYIVLALLLWLPEPAHVSISLHRPCHPLLCCCRTIGQYPLCIHAGALDTARGQACIVSVSTYYNHVRYREHDRCKYSNMPSRPSVPCSPVLMCSSVIYASRFWFSGVSTATHSCMTLQEDHGMLTYTNTCEALLTGPSTQSYGCTKRRCPFE